MTTVNEVNGINGINGVNGVDGLNSNDTWDTRIKGFLDVISEGKKESCGYLISELITEYFPENETDIFTLLPERSSTGAFKREKLEKELDKNIFEKIKQNLIEYRDNSNKRSKYMTDLVKQCDSFYINLTKKMSKVNVIPIAITFSFMHLAILKERNTYHKEIYKTGKSSGTYQKDLQQKVQDYKQYFVDIYSEWETWRKDQINKIDYNNRDPQVFDAITNRGIKYEGTDQTEEAKKRYEEMRNRVVSRYLNEAKVEFMKMYLHTFALDKFLDPKAPTIAPNREIGTVICGIYGRETYPDGDHNKADHDQLLQLCDDKPGVITGINIHAGFFVDCIKVKYEGYVGTAVGNDKGGNAYTIRGLNRDSNYVTRVDVYFEDRIVSGVQFFFSNDPSSKGDINHVIGNEEKTPDKDHIVSCGPIGNNDFRLVGIQMAASNAIDQEHHDVCVSHVSFIFEHLRIKES